MSSLVHSHRLLRRALVVAAAAVTLLATALVTPAYAHGNIVNPASRNRACFDRWGTNHMSPAMATEDPMCYQAWQANPSAMWGWMGQYRDGVRGNHQAAVPDGQLCSAGRAQNGQFNALDAVGAWKTTAISNSFTARILDEASHGADYIRVYATTQGFDATTQPLGWGDLELVGQIGNTPASQWKRVTGGVELEFAVNAPGRTGRHVLFTVWQASHNDQSYYWCSDVSFSGGA